MQRHDGGLFQPADQRRRHHRHSRRRAPWLYNHSRSRYVPERAARPEKGSPARLRQSRAREKVAGVRCVCGLTLAALREDVNEFQCQMLGCPMSGVKSTCQTTQSPTYPLTNSRVGHSVSESWGHLTTEFDIAHWTSQHLTLQHRHV